MADWFYGNNGTQSGPVPEQELANLMASGLIGPSTLLWREGLPQWATLDALRQRGELSFASSPYASPAAHYTPYPETSGLAIASLVCGIVGLISCMVPLGIPAVICGHMAMNRIAKDPFRILGRGMAITGLVCGYVCLLITLFSIGFFVFAMSSGFADVPLQP